MPTIDKDAKTVRIVCQERNVVHARQVIQEILDDNPGYTPVLVVEDAKGKQTTHTSLSAPVEDEVAEPIEEPAEETEESTEEEAVEDTSDEESTDEEATEEEA